MNERIGSSLSGGETDSKNRRGNRKEEVREGAIEGKTMSRILAFFTLTGRVDTVFRVLLTYCAVLLMWEMRIQV